MSFEILRRSNFQLQIIRAWTCRRAFVGPLLPNRRLLALVLSSAPNATVRVPGNDSMLSVTVLSADRSAGPLGTI
ncbi:hypothetical protein LshimejAT787_1402270 [Lyophyllum shimeji]|uniref:Uncharacterized protein n=1 Tax=Lyophyllum shimeji TaxID=47721 RepID=A0A9P3PXB1_LYOSH|nr:hypothetical protein LshimejAT787_1402270 [Lyophyllum shimeji]